LVEATLSFDGIGESCSTEAVTNAIAFTCRALHGATNYFLPKSADCSIDRVGSVIKESAALLTIQFCRSKFVGFDIGTTLHSGDQLLLLYGAVAAM
jgi:hypothetical protein